MKVLDMLNFKWYEKNELIEESIKALMEDGTPENEARKEAIMYVAENSLTMEDVAKWVKERI